MCICLAVCLQIAEFASAFQLASWGVKDQYFAARVWQVRTAEESGWSKPLFIEKPLRINTYVLEYDCWGYLPAVTTQTTTGSTAWNQDMFNWWKRQLSMLALHLYQWNSHHLLDFVCVCRCVWLKAVMCVSVCQGMYVSDVCFYECGSVCRDWGEGEQRYRPQQVMLPLYEKTFSAH